MSAPAAALRAALPPLPPRMARLPRDARGYPVPWFVAWLDERGELVADGQGTPSFPQMNPNKMVRALRERLCWVCGERLGTRLIFVIGPMCAVNRTTSEPACHIDCAEFSARGCPFLTRPKMGRVPGAPNAAGYPIDRNPGVILLWTTRSYRPFRAHAGGEGILLRLGPAEAVRWYREGRAASREEVLDSVAGGLPELVKLAEAEGPEAVAELDRLYRAFLRLVPAA